VAFVGGGAMARAHVRAMAHSPDPVIPVGVFDLDTAAATEFAREMGTDPWPSFEELLEARRPDVVHVCTTAGTHTRPTVAALHARAHVYVEKPFVESVADARTVLAAAAAAGRLVCAGHQLLSDPAYERLRRHAPAVAPWVRAESELCFRPPSLRHDASAAAMAAQLIDVLPHPLYSLVAALEWMAPDDDVHVRACVADAHAVDAVLVCGPVRGRLHVSLTARPVSSTLTVVGHEGAVRADFIRGNVWGTRNPGTSPLEKLVNPLVHGALEAVTASTGVVRRVATGAAYPGLAEMIARFHRAVRTNGVSPTAPTHLVRVAGLHETIAAEVHAAVRRHRVPTRRTQSVAAGPLVAVTGAGGFLGRRVARALVARGFRVRGIGRAAEGPPEVEEWVRADVSRSLPPAAFAGVAVIVHTAACTSGGFDAHQRHSVDAVRRVVDAAAEAGVVRVVHVSSLSVIRPPSSATEVQDEATALAEDAAALGAYTWGKSESERVLATCAADAGVAVRIVRPAALLDADDPDLPGLAGRRLFGAWHLCLGRPSLPFAACDVDDAAQVIAHAVATFDWFPGVLNLSDPAIRSRRALLAWMRDRGWRGRACWVPISLLAVGLWAARWAAALRTRRRPVRLSPWQVLRPRTFDTGRSAIVMGEARRHVGLPLRSPASPAMHDAARPLASAGR
jgi:nucleoside-diphosphate-sugar epimerase/predicted dehydrogenase